MNSIDTFIPTLSPLRESEDGVTSLSMAAPDAAALEALRALMGGFTAPAPTLGMPGAPSRDLPACKLPPTALPAVLEQLLKSDGLPPALVPLLTNLRGSLQKGDTAQPDPSLVADIKALLREMLPAQLGVSTTDHVRLPSSPLVVQPTAAKDLAGSTSTPSVSVGLPSSPLVVQPTAAKDLAGSASSPSVSVGLPSSPLVVQPTAAKDLAGSASSPSVSIDTTSAAPAHLAGITHEALRSPVVPAPLSMQESNAHPLAATEDPSAALAGAVYSTAPALLPNDIPADLPTLAQALLHMLDNTPLGSPGSVVMPSFESLVDEESKAPPPPEAPADTQNLGSAILQSLGHQSAPTPVQHLGQTAYSAGAVERVTEVSHLITQMADRVLVTDPLHGQAQEVRIKIADNVMQDTEVRVWRENGGALRVEFDTASAYWSRILNDASPLLSQRLNERLPSGTEAQVTVTVQQQGQQPEDGRSRNRQDPWELAQQAQES